MLILAKSGNTPEIFHTVQGEGRNVGMPTIFVRLSLCNLHCVWCDAYYTFNWVGTPWKSNFPKVEKPDYQIQLEPLEVLENIRRLSNCQNIVLTGGEPLLQQKQLVPLLIQLKELGYWIEIETNGTIIPIVDQYIDQYNCSPKLTNSANPHRIREKEDALMFFSSSTKTWFKFVIQNEGDLEEVLSLITRYKIPRERTFLMPEGITSEELHIKSGWLVDVCKQYGLRFSSRLQIELYGLKPLT